MKEKHSLYFTVIGLITFILIMTAIYSGIKTAMYIVFIPLISIVVFNLLFRYLKEVWASIIVLIMIVIVVHVIFTVWLITIMLFCYLFILIFANYVIKNKKWSSIIMNSVSILYVIISFYIVLQKNL